MKKLFVLIIAVIVLSGCQRTQWTRPNTSEQQFNADKYACEVEARRMYPSTAGQPIGNPTYRTNCYGSGNNLNCTSQQNQQMRSWYDTNAYPRARMEEQCLKARGYYQQAISSPTRATNTSQTYKPKNAHMGMGKLQMSLCKLPNGSFQNMTKSECSRKGGKQ